MPSLLDLGSAIHQDIASHLTRRDAKSLACTCSELQDAAESRIWAELDLNFDPSHGGNYRLWQKANDALVPAGFLESRLEPGDDLLQGALDYLSRLLVKRPQRGSFVRQVSVICQRVTPFSDERFFIWRDRLSAILSLPNAESRALNEAGYVAAAAHDSDDPNFDAAAYDGRQRRSEEADRKFLRRNYHARHVPPQPALARSLASFPVLPAVKELSITFDESTWSEYASAWRRITPNVSSLYVSCRSRQVFPSIQRLGNHPRLTWVPWTTITGLCFLNFHDYIAEFAIAHIEACPRLWHFAISERPTSPSELAVSPRRREIAQALAGKTGLRSIDVPEPYRAMMLELWRADYGWGEIRAQKAEQKWGDLDEFYALAMGYTTP